MCEKLDDVSPVLLLSVPSLGEVSIEKRVREMRI